MALSRPRVILGATPEEILETVRGECPEIDTVLNGAANLVPWCKRQIAPYQGAVLYWLASRLEGTEALEIGTAQGYSAAIIAQAMPNADLTTLNPKAGERETARQNLRPLPNVHVLGEYSGDYLESYEGPLLSLVFVDGDHRREGVLLDAQWFNWLTVGGLILFHDYSPAESQRPCPSVKGAVDEFARGLGRGPDVLIVDDKQVGMCGFYRREGETYYG